MLREVLFLIGPEGEILYSDASDSAVALPDSRARWEAIWTHRAKLEEIAHSHPIGPLAFSEEDETTMAALRTALGKPLRFSVFAPQGSVRREGGADRVLAREEEPAWARRLRICSNMENDDEEPGRHPEHHPQRAVGGLPD